MTNPDIRWKQRFDNYIKALSRLDAAVTLAGKRPLSELEQQGLVQAFEFTHELSWKLLKDFLEDRGNTGIFGSKDAIREAFSAGIITNGEIWMDMLVKRNLSNHTYNQSIADDISDSILNRYIGEFHSLRNFMETR